MRSSRQAADHAHAEFSAARGKLLESIGALLRDEEWRGDGARDLASWLAARWQMSLRTARELVREAQALAERPAVLEAMATGSISVDQSKALAVLDDPEVWLENLEYFSYTELEREARKTVVAECERRDGGVYLRTRHTRDERFLRGEFQIHPDDGALLIAALDARIPENTPLRRLDHASASALVELAKGSVITGPPVVLTVREGDGVASMANGAFVPEATAKRLSCDARVQTMDKHDTSRTSRTVSPAMRRAVLARDHGMCVFPGCEMTAFVEVHHIVHYADGGPTSLPNLLTLCWRHHELVHEGHWSLCGEAGPHIAWIRPDGTVLEPRVRVTLDTS
jgi:hypothetical protein